VNPALVSSKRMDWCTPENVLELVRQVGPIALDPCTNYLNPVHAETFCADAASDCEAFGTLVARDGLTYNWSGFPGLVYVNPPYGRQIPRWVDKCIQEADKGAEILLLVPARTDTRWFDRLVNSANSTAFWKGRMTFENGDPAALNRHVYWHEKKQAWVPMDPAPFPTLLAYWGRRDLTFHNVFVPFANIW